MQRSTILVGEHPSRVLVARADELAVPVLLLPPLPQLLHGDRVQGDAAVLAVLGLRVTCDDDRIDLHSLLTDDETTGVEVDVLPTESRDLTAPQASSHDQLVKGTEPVSSCNREERTDEGARRDPALIGELETHGASGRFPISQLVVLKERVEKAVEFIHRIARG